LSKLKDELRIDKYALDEEWQRQSLLYNKWAEAYAEAVEERDIAELELDVVEAELFESVKKDWRRYGLDRSPTDTRAKQIVKLQPQYREAYERYVKAKKNVNMIEAARRALEHKKKALEFITLLWLANYYAEPYVPKEARERMEDLNRKLIQEKLTSLVRKRLKEED